MPVDTHGTEYYAAPLFVEGQADEDVVLVIGGTELFLNYEGACRLTYELTEAITRKWRHLDD